MRILPVVMASSVLVLLGGCAVMPSGPSVMVLPGANKSFDDFRVDDAHCRQYAQHQVGGREREDPAVRSAVVGTVVGAAAGAALGGRQGASVGAGTGLLFGSVAGDDSARRYSYGSQRQYDNAYVQCMYGKGHRVPVPASLSGRRTEARSEPAPSVNYPPPPPSFAPPPSPPPDYVPPPMR